MDVGGDSMKPALVQESGNSCSSGAELTGSPSGPLLFDLAGQSLNSTSNNIGIICT